MIIILKLQHSNILIGNKNQSKSLYTGGIKGFDQFTKSLS
jgi:hypothetical protein